MKTLRFPKSRISPIRHIQPKHLICCLMIVCFSCQPQEKSKPLPTDPPGTYIADQPDNIKIYFDSLHQEGLTEIYIHNSDSNKLKQVQQSIVKLQQYASGQQKYYPAEDINKALQEMAFEQGYLYGHGSEFPNKGETFFFRYLEQAARVCPTLSFLTEIHTSDGNAGVLYFPDWSQINPLYSFFLFRNKTGGFNVQQIGETGLDKINHIYRLTDTAGNTYYLCTCHFIHPYFRAFLYRTTDNQAQLLCYIPQAEINNTNWIAPDTDYEIIFNPQKVCWNYCYQKNNLYYPIEGTSTLFLQLNGDESYFYVK